MIVVVSKKSAAQAKRPWPGIFLLHGTSYTHIVTPSTLHAYQTLGYPSKTVTYAQHVALAAGSPR